MINAVAQCIAFDFAVDREGATMLIVMELHLGSIETGFAVNEITNGSILDDHAGPEWVTRETEEK